jgi:hypothetical protein
LGRYKTLFKTSFTFISKEKPFLAILAIMLATHFEFAAQLAAPTIFLTSSYHAYIVVRGILRRSSGAAFSALLHRSRCAFHEHNKNNMKTNEFFSRPSKTVFRDLYRRSIMCPTSTVLSAKSLLV